MLVISDTCLNLVLSSPTQHRKMMFVPVNTLYMTPYYVISIPLTGQSHFFEYTVHQRRTAKTKTKRKMFSRKWLLISRVEMG